MASLDVSFDGVKTTIRLTGLDISWDYEADGDRVVVYTIYKGSGLDGEYVIQLESTIEGAPDSGGEIAVSHLGYDTEYYVVWRVYNERGILISGSADTFVTPSASAPQIFNIRAAVLSNDDMTLTLHWETNVVFDGFTVYFENVTDGGVTTRSVDNVTDRAVVFIKTFDLSEYGHCKWDIYVDGYCNHMLYSSGTVSVEFVEVTPLTPPANLRIERELPPSENPEFYIYWDQHNEYGSYKVFTSDRYQFAVDFDGELPAVLSAGTYTNASGRSILKYGTLYTIEVFQYDDSGNGSEAAYLRAYTRPQMPTLTVSSEAAGKLSIGWSFDTSLDFYNGENYDYVYIRVMSRNDNSFYRLFKYSKEESVYSMELELPANEYFVEAWTMLYDEENDEEVVSASAYAYATVSVAKPEAFSWTYPKEKGGGFNLTAGEWESFMERIRQTLLYAGRGDITYTVPVSGADFTADMYNQARMGIQMTGDNVGSYIPAVFTGDDITADTAAEDPAKNNINVIVNELNAVIENLT